MQKIKLTSNNIDRHKIKNDIEAWLKDEVEIEDIITWCDKEGFEITSYLLRKMKKKIFKTVIDEVKQKSAELVTELSVERLNLGETIEKGIKQINYVLDNTDLDDIAPKNARELAQLLQAKANLTRAELEIRGQTPKRNIQILQLIQEKEKEKSIKKESS